MADSDFRFVAYRKDTGSYLHFGYSAEMTRDRTAADHGDIPADLVVVVDLGDKGWPFVDQPHKHSLADALAAGIAVD